ncbi:LptF/LptG family permease [Gracilinema caldarium]|uniref:Permease YjgP/YjgQ family protein n=1 Tax=Gracilinema caldarium (strain ATCC 51460 / DSM 7334 / H1) TaxID=744872 RepID=F8F3D0_GRAC1|nr:LptF/LptG family permease [Gracilinema caldarium]AEJ19506.1 permease YjgP/YjgQ family protein [Gracilinema caldarium DSM 7334]
MTNNDRGLSITLFRYIFTEAAFSFLVAFLFFFFIFFINQLLLMAEEILSKRVPFNQVMLLLLYSLPAIVAMAAPFAALVGILMAIGRLSSDNEVLVLLASGFSYKALYLPVIVLGLGISLLSFIANDILLPIGTLEFGKLYRKILIASPALELESNTVKRFKDTMIITGEASGKNIDHVIIVDRTSDGERRIIIAKYAELRINQIYGNFTINLYNSFMQTFKDSNPMDYDYVRSKLLQYSISQNSLSQVFGSLGPREMSSADVWKEIKKKQNIINNKIENKQMSLFEIVLSMENILRQGDIEQPNRDKLYQKASLFNKEVNSLKDIIEDRNLKLYKLEFYKKFSIPFGALSFVFLAIPLGLFARKSGQTVGFGFGLLIAVVYWALLIGGQTLGSRLGYSPFWAMWLPNIMAIVIGTLLGLERIRQ